MNPKIKVTLEYWSHFRNATSEDYRIAKISGCPTVEVLNGNGHKLVRVGDLIDESQATDLSSRVETITIPKSV